MEKGVIETNGSAHSWDNQVQERVVEALLIVKWGGVLTTAGRAQAETLGENFRLTMYQGIEGDEGMGLLRLHSSYRHDLKIYSSEEGRVRTTAAAFAKGFLNLESEHLTPIMVSLVRCHVQSNIMLDDTTAATDLLSDIKKKLHVLLDRDIFLTDDDIKQIAPTMSKSFINALKKINNPRQALTTMYIFIFFVIIFNRYHYVSNIAEELTNAKGILIYIYLLIIF